MGAGGFSRAHATIAPAPERPAPAALAGSDEPRAAQVACVSLCWSADGNWLYSGYTDGAIRVWGVSVR